MKFGQNTVINIMIKRRFRNNRIKQPDTFVHPAGSSRINDRVNAVIIDQNLCRRRRIHFADAAEKSRRGKSGRPALMKRQHGFLRYGRLSHSAQKRFQFFVPRANYTDLPHLNSFCHNTNFRYVTPAGRKRKHFIFLPEKTVFRSVFTIAG